MGLEFENISAKNHGDPNHPLNGPIRPSNQLHNDPIEPNSPPTVDCRVLDLGALELAQSRPNPTAFIRNRVSMGGVN